MNIENNKKFQPLVKWSGSKRKVASQLVERIPDYDRYFEPFLGGGAMLPYAVTKKSFANDIIPELINIWKLVQTDPNHVYEAYRERWENLQNIGPSYFYDVRTRFNNTRDCDDFLFLTRTCINGLIRFNSKNEFNSSLHITRPGIDPENFKNIIFTWYNVIQNTTFTSGDYRDALVDVKSSDFVFMDPPYSGAQDRYTKIEFNLNDFYEELERLNSIGCKWMLTFDGSGGKRKYNYAPPQELYKNKFPIYTGHSPFTKVENKKIEAVIENVYTNY